MRAPTAPAARAPWPASGCATCARRCRRRGRCRCWPPPTGRSASRQGKSKRTNGKRGRPQRSSVAFPFLPFAFLLLPCSPNLYVGDAAGEFAAQEAGGDLGELLG